MEARQVFGRKLRICYYNTDERSLDANRIDLEKKLKFLGDFELYQMKRLDDPRRAPCDLLVVLAKGIPDQKFGDWLDSFSQRLERQGDIWLPALIISGVPFTILRDMIENAIRMNWYFDIVSPDHLDSLPVRVANLLRIHDHLHELKRYETALNSLSGQLEQVSEAVKSLKGK